MAIVHSEIIKDKMVQLANVTSQAQTRITPQILSNASREMLENLGEDDYQLYATNLSAYNDDTFLVFDEKGFESLTFEERSLRNLIFAEAYFGLYYLAIGLKKLVKGSVMTSREASGGSQIATSPYDEIIANADNYRENAYKCLDSSLGKDDNNDNIYSDGTMAVFIV